MRIHISCEVEMTEKLYYIDAYIKEFTATVTDVIKDSRGVALVLDRTAFFPEREGRVLMAAI